MTTTPNTLDVSGDLSSFLKRDDFLDGPHRFRITHVERATFEAKGGRPSQTRIVLTVSDDRKFSLNKTNLKVLAKAWGKSATAWIGKTIEIYLNPDIEMAGEIVGGLRIRLTDPVGRPARTAAPVAADEDAALLQHVDDISFAMPTLNEPEVR